MYYKVFSYLECLHLKCSKIQNKLKMNFLNTISNMLHFIVKLKIVKRKVQENLNAKQKFLKFLIKGNLEHLKIIKEDFISSSKYKIFNIMIAEEGKQWKRGIAIQKMS